MLRVCISQLTNTLRPISMHLLSELRLRLPSLAAARYAQLSADMLSATHSLTRAASNVEEYVDQLAFLAAAEVTGRRNVASMRCCSCCLLYC